MVGVWVGNNDNTPMTNVASGVSGASPIWRKIITEALKGKAAVKFEVPGGINQTSVDSVSGYASHDGFLSRNEYFIRGTEPGTDPVHVMLKVCKSDGKLANPSDVAAGNYDNREFYIFKEEDPTAGAGGQNRWQEGILSWLNTMSDSKYHPPTDYCGTSNPLNVEFTNPHDHDSMLPGSFTVAFTANSSSNITMATLKVNDEQKCAYSSGANSYTCPIGPLTNGVYILTAEATDSSNHKSNRVITVGVGVNWDSSPPPTP